MPSPLPARPLPVVPRVLPVGQTEIPLFRQRRKGRGLRWIFWFLMVGIVGIGGSGLFLISKGVFIGRSIEVNNASQLTALADVKRLARSLFADTTMPLKGEENGRVNLLLLGRAGELYPGKNLTDTVMVMSIDTERKKVALLSLPRDFYVPIPGTSMYTKLNALYQYGLSTEQGATPVRRAVEEITGLPIHYFSVVDFDGFEKAINALGGIEIDVARDFYDPRYPGKNYSYETFSIKKGWQTLDGATALKYVRERRDDPEGDFGRAKRQQQVLQAMKNKLFSLGTLSNVLAVNSLLDTLGASVKTDLTLADMERLVKLSKTVDTQNVVSVVIDAWKPESLLRVSRVQVGQISAFILVPRVGNYSEIRDVSENIFMQDVLRERRERIASEQASLDIFFAPEDRQVAEKMKRLAVEYLGIARVSLLPITTRAPYQALKNYPDQSIIIDRTSLRKPYAFDELLKRFPLYKTETLPFPPPDDTALGDFAVVLGKDLVETLAFDEESDPTLPDTVFADPLPPQPKQRSSSLVPPQE